MTSNQVRQVFLDFFASKQHLLVPSASMVVKDDPTLMFTNAGMNQFKDYFLGNAKPKSLRIADSQKCLRVSGKQNDLEEVGLDTYHHTMFEMLGNWSFGDYFKEQAIAWAWELLVEVYHLNPDRLYATVFEGAPGDGIAMDQEAYDFWSKYLPKERILLGSAKDNFWEMGDTGPCGPCSEIHVDIRPDEERKLVPGVELVNRDHPQVIEIWNLVFIQYNRVADGSLAVLPAKHVDTGMGLERLCMILQGKRSNYDTDIFQTLIASFAERSGVPYGASREGDIALRVVSDHLRAVAFSIADGQLPSNNRAGYVIRRILRRAVRYGYSFLGFRKPFLYASVDALVDLMGEYYPELTLQKELIVRVIQEEEASFLRTLESGIHLLEDLIRRAHGANSRRIDGEAAFTLYDTYGFPLDLTELMLRERGMSVDTEAFLRCMDVQKTRSRSAATVTSGDWEVFGDVRITEFVGYDTLEFEVRVQRMRTVEVNGKKSFHLVLDRTPFYAESGGQVGDSGLLTSAHETIHVLNVIKEHSLPVHVVDRFPEDPHSTFHAIVDSKRRQAITCHHTATHLLHHALRKVLGSHVEQKGSLVDADYLRFDFSHFQRLSSCEIRAVEKIVNAMSRQAIARGEFRNIPVEEAKSMGAIALFGEKYGDTVRVIRFGDSVEFCGGSHLENTGSIGLFRVVSEGAISAGVRRIVAIAGEVAEQRDYEYSDNATHLDELLHAQGKILEAVTRLRDENVDLKKKLSTHRTNHLRSLSADLFDRASRRGDVVLVEALLSDLTADDLKELALILRAKESTVAILGAVVDSKPSFVIAISDDLLSRPGFHAGNVIREAAKVIQGGGGGQSGLASAGGKKAEALQMAIRRAVELFNF